MAVFAQIKISNWSNVVRHFFSPACKDGQTISAAQWDLLIQGAV